MNKRILELAEQAGFMLWGNESWNPGDIVDWSARYDDELAKFAELIVKECADIADDNDNGSSDEWDKCARAISRDIKLTFGVEE